MRIALPGSLLLFLTVSCGGGGGGGKGGEQPAVAAAPSNMLTATTKADITCNASAKNYLFYATSDSKFYLCDGTALTEIDIKGKDGANGTDGKDGLKVDKYYNLSSSISDYETRYSNLYFSFLGGRLIKFNSGLRQFSGTFISYSEYSDTTVEDPDLDTDTFETDISDYVSSGILYSKVMKIARVGSDTDRQLWMLYDYSNDSVEIWYDTDNNGTYNPAADTKLDTLTKTEITL